MASPRKPGESREKARKSAAPAQARHAPPKSRAFERLLRSDPELLRSLIDQAADAVCLHEIGGQILDVNQRMCATLGYAREELLALSVLNLDVTATREETAAAAAKLEPGVPGTAERLLRRKDGSTVPIELSLSVIESGEKQLMLGIARDITDRKRAERVREDVQKELEERVRERTRHLELANVRLEEEIQARARSERALRKSEQLFRDLAERGRLIAWESDARTWQFTYVSPQALDLLGYPLEEWLRPGFWVDHIHPDERDRVVGYCREQSTAGEDYEFEYRLLAADGDYLWIQDIVHVIRDAEGPSTLRGFMVDITARKQAEEASNLLLRELDHRVKNVLATVQAVAELTLRTSKSMQGFGETFRGRISALARMHGVIWRNKGTPLRLRELVELSLAAFGREKGRASIEGEDVSIPLQAAGSISLVLHELATNAVKHGALSVPSGRVRVSWAVRAGEVTIRWRESGGPQVTPPSHRGFGSVLIERSIPHELGGTAAIDFAPAGISCTVSFPLAEAPLG